MTRKSKARYGLKRTYKLNPCVKALRSALMASMLAAAVAPSVALAAPPFIDVPVNYQGFAGQYVYNYGDVYASAQNIAAAIVAVSSGYDASIYNTGNLSAIADAGLYNEFGDAALAAGIYIGSAGDSSVSNYGNATVLAKAINNGNAYAYGIAVGARSSTVGGYAEVHNEGNINVSANTESGDASAFGIVVQAFGDVSTYNAGDITISAYSLFGNADASGLLAESNDGDAYVYNSGILSISAESIYGSASASGMSAEAYDLARVYNTGDITASAAVSGIANYYTSTDTTANAYGISASGEQVSVTNAGDITLSVSNDLYLGESTAIGINADGYNGATITNSGDIAITASSGGGAFAAWQQDPTYTVCGYYYCYVTGAGTIDTAGIRSESAYGVTTITNSGDISITDLNPGGGFLGNLDSGDYLKGIDAFNNMGEVSIVNSGDIVLEGGKWDFGILAQTGTTLGTKSTYIYDYGYGNYGYYDLPYAFGGSDVSVVNSGNITISAGVTHPYGFLNYRASFGIAATTDVCGTRYYWLDDSTCGGDVSVLNSGEINVSNTGSGGAVGIAAYTSFLSSGEVYVGNSGDMNIFGTEFASGISAKADTGDVYVKNVGNLTLTTDASRREGRAIGIDAFSEEGSATVLNSGDIISYGDIAAGGIRAGSFVGDVNIVNTGDVSANSSNYYTLYNYYYGTSYALGGNAFGLRASTVIGISNVQNAGDIEVYGVINAYGIITNAQQSSAYTLNTGDIHVSNGDNAYAGNVYGIISNANGRDQYLYSETAGYTTVLNSGDITASSQVLAVGIQLTQAYGNITLYNSGDLNVVVDNAGYGNAFGLVGLNVFGNVDIINTGDITVASGGNVGGIIADTTGDSDVYFPGNVAVQSGGALSVTSEYGRASAITASSRYGAVSVDAGGSIEVSAYDRALGISAISNYNNVEVTSYADINVTSSNYNAAGIRGLSEYNDVSIFNYGDIDVHAETLAQGIVALSYYASVGIRNEGDVTASSAGGYSQAVALRSGTGSNAILRNFGTITAGSGNSIAVSITGGNGVISNYGDISGGMLTDAGDDYVRNYQGGRMFLTDDTIDLGGGYNYFLNEGKVYADGSDNVIDMGYYGEGSGLFVNNGSSIHMEDGAADDALTIIGDFAGSGDINVDVDGASGDSDRLFIEGNVLSGTANTLNVNLLSLPSAADIVAGETIDIISVSGTSVASNFVLGTVNTSHTALFTTDYSLVYGGGDYALGFEVTGLSTAGVLLSTAAPAIQNLWYSSLGTMYQRQGAERRFSADGSAEVEGAAGVWGRYYANDGSMTPDASRNNFGGGGSQNFDVSSNGLELGVGYSFNASWTVGVLGGTMEGDYKPEAGGKTDLDGKTLGAYLTYVHGNGFYADLSYRAFSFDGDVRNGSETLLIDGDANGFSLEMGYGFKTASNLEIEPQMQFSSMSVSMDDIDYNNGDFELTDGDSSQFRLGVALRKSYQQDSGLWTPYGALSYVNVSSASNRYNIGGALEGGVDTSGGSTLLEFGTDARYSNWVFNVGISMQDGGAYDFVFGGQLNVRYAW